MSSNIALCERKQTPINLAFYIFLSPEIRLICYVKCTGYYPQCKYKYREHNYMTATYAYPLLVFKPTNTLHGGATSKFLKYISYMCLPLRSTI